jgi:hypothetical protein
MPATVTFNGGLAKVFSRLENPDLTFLMVRIEALMTEDHTRSILAGLDKDGIPFRPVTYRPRGVVPGKTKGQGRGARGRFLGNRGVGPALQDASGNLTSAAYRKLAGPPLAPRGKSSRIIANFATRSGFDGRNWTAEAALIDVVDRKGRPFMQYHFDGAGRLPRRDDRGIRPWGREQIRAAIRAEFTKRLRGA